MKTSATPRNLLVVDADPDSLASLAEGLAQAGYRVTSACNAQAALACAREEVFGLALLDLRLPDMTGAALASQLMSKTGCFSLILSGHADPESVSSAVRNGALGYLVKPLSIAELVPAIETALARARELAGLQRSHDQLSLAVGENRDTSVAVGVLMERLRIDQDAAFAKLRDAARDQRRKLAEFAREVVLAANTLNGVGRS